MFGFQVLWKQVISSLNFANIEMLHKLHWYYLWEENTLSKIDYSCKLFLLPPAVMVSKMTINVQQGEFLRNEWAPCLVMNVYCLFLTEKAAKMSSWFLGLLITRVISSFQCFYGRRCHTPETSQCFCKLFLQRALWSTYFSNSWRTCVLMLLFEVWENSVWTNRDYIIWKSWGKTGASGEEGLAWPQSKRVRWDSKRLRGWGFPRTAEPWPVY